MAGSKGRNEVDRPILAALVAGGEGKVVREVQVLEANLLVGLGAREGDRRSSSTMGCGRRRREKRTAAFRCGIGGEGWLVSFTGAR